MKRSLLLVTAISLLSGCATYKLLEPKPEISPAERGYIEIKDEAKDFELSKDKKYFIKFPKADREDFYLVLKSSQKSKLRTYLTRAFDDGKGTIIKISDESPKSDSLFAYKLDSTVPIFYWVIDSVVQDLVFKVNYRFIPTWRYQFETKLQNMVTSLKNNSVDPSKLNNLGKSFSFEGFNFNSEISQFTAKQNTLKSNLIDLSEALKSVPAEFQTSSDDDFRTYTNLKDAVEKEIKYQDDYLLVLNLFRTESESRKDIGKFVAKVSDFNLFFSQKNRYPATVYSNAQSVLGKRLSEVSPYYDSQIKQKPDVSFIKLPTDEMERLFENCNVTKSDDFISTVAFIRAFNQNFTLLDNGKSGMKDIAAYIKSSGSWPSNSFYEEIGKKTNQIRLALPRTNANYGKYKTVPSVAALNKDIENTQKSTKEWEAVYLDCEILVERINKIKENQGSYHDMIVLLRKNSDLDFLLGQYSDIDLLSITQQKQNISAALAKEDWDAATDQLRNFFSDTEFLKLSTVNTTKYQTVKLLEEELYKSVESTSVQHATQFGEENKLNTENISSLYENDALYPVYNLTFFSANETEFKKKKNALIEKMRSMREEQFPALAIESLYKLFTADISDKGVERAHAIADHGKQYKGKDKKIINLAVEVDPSLPKWITKATAYRKIYVVPVNRTRSANNDYTFKINIQIETEAAFPVFDINIKLPQEIAKSAGTQKWYESMTLNKKPLKNEGRFSISAPTSKNDYECQVTPIQMKQQSDNILEVSFNYPSYKVFEISVMGQKPIIKKN